MTSLRVIPRTDAAAPARTTVDPFTGARRLARRPVRRSTGPDPLRLARALVLVLLEIEAGLRPAHQLEDIVSPAVLAHVTAVATGHHRQRRARRRVADPVGTLLHLGGNALDDGRVWEVVAVVRRRDRVGSVCVRLERHLGAWRCTELTCPEHHAR